MKSQFLLALFALTIYSNAQELTNPKIIDQYAIYPTCEDSIDNLPNCFDTKLNEDVQVKLSKIKLDKILKNPGKYFAKINFVLDEEGNFTNFRISGNDVLGRISKEILIKINTEQTTNNTKIIPAKLNGTPVKINYNLPIEYKVN